MFGALQVGLSQQALTPHHVQNEDVPALRPVEDSARRLHNLAVARFFKFGGSRTQARMLLKFVYVRKNTPHELSGSGWIFDCDVVGDGFEIR